MIYLILFTVLITGCGYNGNHSKIKGCEKACDMDANCPIGPYNPNLACMQKCLEAVK